MTCKELMAQLAVMEDAFDHLPEWQKHVLLWGVAQTKVDDAPDTEPDA